MPPVLAILLDGMRFDYLSNEDTPFLHSSLEDATVIQRLRKSAAFCERSELYTGEDACVTGNYAAFTYDPEASPYRKILKNRVPLRLADSLGYRLPRRLEDRGGILLYKVQRRLRRALRGPLAHMAGEPVFSLNDIPWEFASLFRLTEDRLPPDAAEAFSVPTIFDSMRQSGLQWLNLFEDLRHDPRAGQAQPRVAELLQAFGGQVDLYLYATSEADAVGHVLGTGRAARAEIMRKTDRLVERIHKAFFREHPDGFAVYFSPHGMMDVERVFDAETELLSHLGERGWAVPRDCVYFLDSTMLRLWGRNVDQIAADLSGGEWGEHGQWVNGTMAEQYCLPSPAEGREVIWWADPGVCIFPDFFRRFRPPRGMHGYRPDEPAMDGFALIAGRNMPSVRVEMMPLKSLRAAIESLLAGQNLVAEP